MKRTLLGIGSIVAVTMLGVLLLSGTSESQSAVITVKGMKCQNCADRVNATLGEMEGVAQSEVDLNAGTATVQFDPAAVSLANIETAIHELGFNRSDAEMSMPAGSKCEYLKQSKSGCCEEAANPS